MWTERQVRLWHDLCQKPAAHLDATGTIVGNWNGKKVLYYALVVTLPDGNSSPIPVAELISTRHNVPTITAFLDHFKYDHQQLTSSCTRIVPRQIITDRANALMLASIKSFNTENMITFLQRAYRIVAKQAKTDDFQLMIPHVCCSHMMKNFYSRIKATHTNSKFHSFLLYVCSLLVNSSSLEELSDTYKEVYLLLSCQNNATEVNQAYQSLTKKMKDIGQSDHDDVENTSETSTNAVPLLEEQEEAKVMHSPFSEHFEAKAKEVEKEKKMMRFLPTKNACYNEALLEYINSVLATCPFWSAILLGSLKRYDIRENNLNALTFRNVTTKTQGQIENYFKILKKHDFRGRTHLRVDEFLKEQYQYLDSRIVSFAEDALKESGKKGKKGNNKKSSRQPEAVPGAENRGSISREYEMAQEEWHKPVGQTQNSTGKYKNPPTHAFPTSTDATGRGTEGEGEKKKNGFQLFLSRGKTRIRKRNKNEGNIARAAAKEWNCLPKEERERWNEKAKLLNPPKEEGLYKSLRKRKMTTRTETIPKNTFSEMTEEKKKVINSKKGNRKAKERKDKKEKETEGKDRKEISSQAVSSEKYAVEENSNVEDSSIPGGDVPRGLKNFGNSCWLNSLLQCICSTKLSTDIVNSVYSNTNSVGNEIANTINYLSHESPMPSLQAFSNQVPFELYKGSVANIILVKGRKTQKKHSFYC